MNRNEISNRKRGGVSHSIDHIYSSIIDNSNLDPADKLSAIRAVADLMRVVIHQAATGDHECAGLLAEALAYLWKNRDRLSAKNETFRKYYSRWESSRLATKKESRLRALINGIIVDAIQEKSDQELSKFVPHSWLVIRRNKTLLALPEFSADPKVVSEWTDKIVYPKLRAMQSKLAEDPVIGNLKKARDKNGKFQISRLESLIKQTVGRIAAVPRARYFNIS
jgi:hypothetical protein